VGRVPARITRRGCVLAEQAPAWDGVRRASPPGPARAQDVRRQMYTADDDRVFFDWIQRELRAVDKRLEDGRACLAHLELALVNVACDDPGAAVGAQLALPLLQERLDGRARAHAAQRAAAAQDAIIRAEARTPGRPCTSSCGARARGALAAAATERDQARRRPALSVRCLSCRQPGAELCFSCTAFNPIKT